MNHIKLTFRTTNEEERETLIALLAGLDFEGFEETEDLLIGYLEEGAYNAEEIGKITEQLQIGHHTEVVAKRNWNEEWEKNFEPVIIDGFCSVRAYFHPKPANVDYDIIITPKMSFGTGHHATTALMMEFMRNLEFRGKTVFDFGTGTGILAILAKLLGAESVLAIDNDDWSVQNAIENCEHNHSEGIAVKLATAGDLDKDTKFNIILANINRHILLEYMDIMASLLDTRGTLLLSGILPEDITMVRQAAEDTGFTYQKEKVMNAWVCMQFGKG